MHMQPYCVQSATCSRTACKVPHAATHHDKVYVARRLLCRLATMSARCTAGRPCRTPMMAARAVLKVWCCCSSASCVRCCPPKLPVLCRRLGLVQLQKAAVARSQLLQKDLHFGQHCPLGILLSCQPIPVGTQLPWLMPGRWGNLLGPTGFVLVSGFQGETVTMGRCQQLQAALYLG